MEEVTVRCRSCHNRFKSPVFQDIIECPTCKQRWKLKWFDKDTATVMAPESWDEFHAKMKEVKK